jgi:transposase-like protein
MWRVDYEIEHAAKRSIDVSRLCPECGEESILNGRFPDSARWLGCASCGNVWLDETNGPQSRMR